MRRTPSTMRISSLLMHSEVGAIFVLGGVVCHTQHSLPAWIPPAWYPRKWQDLPDPLTRWRARTRHLCHQPILQRNERQYLSLNFANAMKWQCQIVMEKFGSVQFSTLNLRTPNQTIRSIRQFSGTLNGTWCSGSKSVRFMFECSSNANVSWDPPAGARAPVWRGGSGTRW